MIFTFLGIRSRGVGSPKGLVHNLLADVIIQGM